MKQREQQHFHHARTHTHTYTHTHPHHRHTRTRARAVYIFIPTREYAHKVVFEGELLPVGAAPEHKDKFRLLSAPEYKLQLISGNDSMEDNIHLSPTSKVNCKVCEGMGVKSEFDLQDFSFVCSHAERCCPPKGSAATKKRRMHCGVHEC